MILGIFYLRSIKNLHNAGQCRTNTCERPVKYSPSYVLNHAPNPGMKQAMIETSKWLAKGEITDEIKGSAVVPIYKINNRSLFAASLLREVKNEL